MLEENHDFLELQEYYDAIYNSDIYIEMKKKESVCNRMKGIYESKQEAKGTVLFLLASIYLVIFSCIIFAYYICFLELLLPPVFIIFNKIGIKKSKKKFEEAKEIWYEAVENYKKYKEKLPIPKPPIPEEMLQKEKMEILLKVFKSGRADSYKEALTIAEQDRQYQELLNKPTTTYVNTTVEVRNY